MRLLQCLVVLDKSHIILVTKDITLSHNQNDNHVKVQLILTFDPTKIQPMWHGYLQPVS